MDPFAHLADLGRSLGDPDTTLRWNIAPLTAAVRADGAWVAWRARAVRGPRLLNLAMAYRDPVFLLMLCALRDEVECARVAAARVALAGDRAADRLLVAVAAWSSSADAVAGKHAAIMEDLACGPLTPRAAGLRRRVLAAVRPRDNPWWLDLWVPTLITEYQREHPALKSE